MIPEFPHFKKLEFSDKADIEVFTRQYPPYSDFNFTSMWCWDIAEQAVLSVLNQNLIVKFCDYLTGQPFYSFLGNNNLQDTVQKLLDKSLEEGTGSELKLVPGDSIKGIDLTKFSIKEDRDHFDYVYSVDELKSYEGRIYETKRNNLNRFMRKHAGTVVKVLDLGNEETQEQIITLDHLWLENKILHKKNPEADNEFKALNRLFQPSSLDLVAIGLYASGKLIAFCISELLVSGYALAHFAKANTHFPGVYAHLMKENAKLLSLSGVSFLNYEQDLGIPSLRHSKVSFRPKLFLKKYSVRRI